MHLLVLLLEKSQLLFFVGSLSFALCDVGFIFLLVLFYLLNGYVLNTANPYPLLLHNRVVQFPQPLVLELKPLHLGSLGQLNLEYLLKEVLVDKV